MSQVKSITLYMRCRVRFNIRICESITHTELWVSYTYSSYIYIHILYIYTYTLLLSTYSCWLHIH